MNSIYFPSHIALLVLFITLSGITNEISSQNNSLTQPYLPVNGSYSGEKVPFSPDPLVSYRWENTKETDDLEIYTIKPISVRSDKPENSNTKKISSIRVTGECNLIFDFGQVNAAWFEFDSDNLDGDIEMSISEFNEPGVFNSGSQNPVKTAKPVRYGKTWRLELNKELYEGVRFAWIHLRNIRKPVTINSARLICQIKPTNYEGAFSCSDTSLTRMWYTGAYDVKLNLLKQYFGAILMERGDRHSWTGDAHPSQAASMVAFGNYDFVRTNLIYTSTQFNGIASYSLYWVLSLIDYYYYTGDKSLLDEMLENACNKLDIAYNHYDTNPNLVFYGWDERLGAGFENPNSEEPQNAYKMLSIQTWNKFCKVMAQAGYPHLSEKYKQYTDEKIRTLREDSQWTASFGVHAATDAINAEFINHIEEDSLWKTAFSDRLQRMSYSPFNQYFILQSLANMGRYPEALSTIDDCWGGQLRYGATTFFEVFRSSWNEISQPNDAPVNNQCGYTSLTHPWSAGITKWLSEEILGIKPTEPGFTTFTVKPHLSASVTWVKGTTPTLYGKIISSFNLNTGKCELTVPSSTTATLCIPKAGLEIKQVKFSGKQYTANNEDDDFIYYYGLPAGHYKINVTYSGNLSENKEEPIIYACKPPIEDTTTKGNWIGNYGSKGYVLCNYDSLRTRMSLPQFIEYPVFSKNENIHWTTRTSDKRALEDLNGTRNIGALITQDPYACMQTMTIDIPCKTKQTYKLSLYFVDWDTSERRSAIEIFDLNDKRLLAPLYMVRDYSGGKYVTYEFDRSVRIRINQVRGINAALSGIFFD